MDKFRSSDEILDFAIEAEQHAADFYKELASKSNNKAMIDSFLEFAKEEMGHKGQLMKIKKNGFLKFSQEQVEDLKISDYLVDMTITDDITYKEALILAMKREKSAYNLYMKISTKTDNSDLKAVLISLANEEAKHKLRFELEYDEYVLREN